MQNQQEVPGEVPRGYELERLEYTATSGGWEKRRAEVAAVTMTVMHGRDAAVALAWWISEWLIKHVDSKMGRNEISPIINIRF